MTRLPKITVNAWTEDGPAYTIHRSLGGWRNRKARRAGESADELVGDHGEEPYGGPAAFLLFAAGEDELWGFNEGYVYEIAQLIDGELSVAHIDARDEVDVHTFRDGVQLLEWRALEDGEVEDLAEPSDPHPVETYSDASESQEPDPGGVDLDDPTASNEDLDYFINEGGALSARDLSDASTPESRDAAYVSAANEMIYPDSPLPGIDPAIVAGEHLLHPGYELPAEPAGDKADPDELTEEQLEQLTAPGEEDDASAETDEDAIGGDGGKSGDVEAERG